MHNRINLLKENKSFLYFRQMLGLGVVLGLAFSPVAQAAVTIGSPATTSISADTAVSGSTALPVLTLTEGAAGDLPLGAISFGFWNNRFGAGSVWQHGHG